MTKKKQIIKLTDAFSSAQQVARVIKSLDFSESWEVEIRPATEKRSLDQSSLYFLWCDQAAKFFSKGKAKYTKKDMHEIFRFKMLGYDSGKKIGNTEFAPELKSTTDLKVDEMYEYMRKVEVWCAEHGLLVKTPEDSDYDKRKKKNGGYD